MLPAPLPRAFFARDACTVARDLIGRRLVSAAAGARDGGRTGGLIVEAEAYCQGPEPDLACHGAKSGGRPTARTAPMFGPPGHAYVYFTYGMHWLFNIVTGRPGEPSAVLVRALAPDEGLAIMAARRRGRPDSPAVADRDLCRGPARLAQALGIDGRHSGWDLCGGEEMAPLAGSDDIADGFDTPVPAIWLEPGSPPPAAAIATGPRIGLGRTPEPWLSMPWRYWLAGDRHVSATRGGG